MTQREINIFIRAFDMASGTIQKVSTALKRLSTEPRLKNLNMGLKNLSGRFTRISTISDAVRDSILRYGESSDALVKKMIGLRKATGKVSANFGFFAKQTKGGQKVMKNLANSTKRFRMEYLGMGFLFMMLGAILMNFVNQAQQALTSVGLIATESGRKFIEAQGAIRNFMMQLGQSDAFKFILDKLKALLDWFDKLSPSMKQTIYWFIVLGAIIFTAISFLAFLRLGLGSTVQGFMNLAGAIIKITSASGIGGLIAVLGPLAPLLALLAVLVAVFAAMWVTNFNNIQKIVGIVLNDIFTTFNTVFGHVWKVVEGVLELILAIFEGDADKFMAALNKVLRNALATILKLAAGIGKIAIEVGVWLISSTVKLALNINSIVFKLLANFVKMVSEWAGPFVNMFIDVGVGIFKALSWPFDQLINLINNVLNALASVGIELGFRLPKVSTIIEAAGSALKFGLSAATEALIAKLEASSDTAKQWGDTLTDATTAFVESLPSLERAFGNIDTWLDSIFGKTEKIGESIKENITEPILETQHVGVVGEENLTGLLASLNKLVSETAPGQTQVNNDINISTEVNTGPISSDIDVKELTDKVSEIILDGLRVTGIEKPA